MPDSVTFLGTSDGLPSPDREKASLLVKFATRDGCCDCQAAFRQLVVTHPEVATRSMIGILRTVGSRLRKTDRQHSDTMLLTHSRKTIR